MKWRRRRRPQRGRRRGTAGRRSGRRAGRRGRGRGTGRRPGGRRRTERPGTMIFFPSRGRQVWRERGRRRRGARARDARRGDNSSLTWAAPPMQSVGRISHWSVVLTWRGTSCCDIDWSGGRVGSARRQSNGQPFFFFVEAFRASSCVPTDALRNRIVVERTATGDRPTPHAPAGPPWAARRTRPWLCFGAPPRVGGRLCWWRGWTQTRRVETAAGQVKVVDRRKGQACQQACAKRLPARAPLIASEAEAKREGRSKGRRRGRHRAAAAARAISLPSPTPARPPSAPTMHTR